MKLSVESAKTFCREHKLKGLEIRSQSSIRAVIRFKSQLHRISLSGYTTTKASLVRASEQVKEYKQLAKFNHDEFKRLLPSSESANQTLLKTYIDLFLETKKHSLASCTYINYAKKIKKHISPKFAHRNVKHIRAIEIEKWVSVELSYLSDKTIRELLSLLTQILTLAVLDNCIDVSPLDSLKASRVIKLRSSVCQPDPFSKCEMKAIEKTQIEYESEQNMVIFNCYAGLRISELMALAWEDIDFERNLIHIQRAVVERQYKTPKTSSSTRTIELLPKARKILLRQNGLRKSPISTISITQADNRSQKAQELRFVFFDTRSGLALAHDKQFRNVTYKKLIVKSGVRWRGINQTRHTYASHLISAGLPLTWVARQMGHNSIKMIEKHYSKWLPTNNANMLALAANAF